MNILAATNAAKTQCPAGHLYDADNTVIESNGGRKCRVCKNKGVRSWYARHRAAWKKAVWERNLRIRYGIGMAEYDSLLHSQGGVCGLCGLPEAIRTRGGDLRRLAVDHDHKTGAIRGLLCSSCNRRLGTLLDNPVWMEQATRYLAKER